MSSAHIVGLDEERKRQQRHDARLDWWINNHRWLAAIVALLAVVLIVKL